MNDIQLVLNRKSVVSDSQVNFIIPLLILPDVLWLSLKLGQGRISFISLIYAMVFFYLLQYKRFREIAISRPLLIWATLTVFHLVNATIKQVPEIEVYDYLSGFKCYASICIFTFCFSFKSEQTFKAIYYSLLTWLIIALLGADVQSDQRLRGEGIAAVALAKAAALMTISAIFWDIMRNGNISTLIYKLVFPVAVVILAQSRNAFGMVCIMLTGYYQSVIMKYKPAIKQLVMIPIVLVFMVISVRYVLNSTGLGERFVNDIEDVEAETYKTMYQTGTVFDYVAGERIIYYATGWEIFKDHFWTGIGLDNYKNYMDGNFPMHVEYMKHLAEGGIIAAFLWIAFLVSLLRVIVKTKISFTGKGMAYFTFGAILFTCMFSVNYGQERQMILYGIILSIAYPSAGNFFYKDIKNPEAKE